MFSARLWGIAECLPTYFGSDSQGGLMDFSLWGLGLDTRYHYRHDHHRRFQQDAGRFELFVCAPVFGSSSRFWWGTMRHGLKPPEALLSVDHHPQPSSTFLPRLRSPTSRRPRHISCGVPDSCSCQSCERF
jgi:hypothetical protein